MRVVASTAPTSVLTQRWRLPPYLLYSVSVVCAQLASWGLAEGEVNCFFVSMSSHIKDSRGCLQSLPASPLTAQPAMLPLPPMSLRNEPGPFCTDILGVLWGIQWHPQCSHPPVQYFARLGKGNTGGVCVWGGVFCV